MFYTFKRPIKKSKSDVFFPRSIDYAPLLSLIDKEVDRTRVEEIITKIKEERRSRKEQLSSILGRIEDFQTQLGNLHETVSRQLVSFK